MKIIRRVDIAAKAIERWERTYSNGGWGQDKLVTLAALKALPTPVDPGEIDRIIGNTSWTRTNRCSQCDAAPDVVIEVGQEPDYESATAWLCVPCIGRLAKFVEGL